MHLSKLIKMQAKTFQVHGNSDISIGKAEKLSHNISQYYSICILIFYSYQPPRTTLRWRHNGCDAISNHQPHDCLLNSLFRRRSKKTSKCRVTGLCAGNSPGTGEFPTQMASNAENVSIWWRHHGIEALLKATVDDDCHGSIVDTTFWPAIRHYRPSLYFVAFGSGS